MCVELRHKRICFILRTNTPVAIVVPRATVVEARRRWTCGGNKRGRGADEEVEEVAGLEVEVVQLNTVKEVHGVGLVRCVC